MNETHLLRSGVGVALCFTLIVSCSSAPPKSDTVTTVKDQAAQNSGFAEAYFRQGRYDLALQFFTQSLNQNTSIDNVEGITQSYVAIGKTYMAMGSLDMAEDIFLKARERARAAASPLFFMASSSLGELYLAKGDPQKALAVFEEALAMPAGSRTPGQTAQLNHNLGTAQKALSNFPKALEYFNKSLEINTAGKLIESAAADYYMIASVYSLQGRYEDAAKSAETALSLDKKIESSPGIAQDLYALGLIATRRRDLAAAYDYFQRSYLVFVTLGSKPGMRKALAELIAATDGLGRSSEADGYRKTLADLGTP
jgi:tetratricopeptide (TPR) repeat protein